MGVRTETCWGTNEVDRAERGRTGRLLPAYVGLGGPAARPGTGPRGPARPGGGPGAPARPGPRGGTGSGEARAAGKDGQRGGAGRSAPRA
ncbi:hypothetical protein GCM10009731_21520 [Streptomyces globosus]